MGDGRTAKADEAEVRGRGIVVDMEADRAEEAVVVLEEAVGAVAAIAGAVPEAVEDDGAALGGAAGVAERRLRGGMRRRWVHRSSI